MITWQSFGRISVPSTSSLGLIPSGKRVDTSQPVLPSYVCISLSLSLSLPPPSFSVFLFCYSLDSRFYLFTPFAFTAFSFLYSNSVSHTLFSFSLSLLPLLSLFLSAFHCSIPLSSRSLSTVHRTISGPPSPALPASRY